MKLLLLSLALMAVISATTALAVPKLIMAKLMKDALLRRCWSDEVVKAYVGKVEAAADTCLSKDPQLELEDLYDDFEAKVDPAPRENPVITAAAEMFRSRFDEIRREKVLKMSNFTCVMKETKMWNDDNSVNMDWYLEEMWKDIEMPAPFKEGLMTEAKLCFKMSQAAKEVDVKLPDPLLKHFGPQLFFHKCFDKAEVRQCTLKHAATVLEDALGPIVPETIKRLGLPKDPQEAAAVAFQVLPMLHAPERRFALDMVFDGVPNNPFERVPRSCDA